MYRKITNSYRQEQANKEADHLMSQVRPPGQKRETFFGKLSAKMREDPLVPVGCIATAGILIGGLYTMWSNNPSLSQRFMRARLVAQGATVVVLCTGGVMMGNGLAPKRETFEDKFLKERAERRAIMTEQSPAAPPTSNTVQSPPALDGKSK